LSPDHPHGQRQTYLMPLGKQVPPFRQGVVEQACCDSALHTITESSCHVSLNKSSLKRTLIGSKVRKTAAKGVVTSRPTI